jgi:hypothetical protein
LSLVGDTQSNDTRGGSPSPGSVRRAKAAARQLEAIQLRRDGNTFQVIAERLGYSNRSAAEKAYLAGLERWGSKDVADLRDAEVDRLDSYLASIAPQVAKGSLYAIDRAVRISERRSKLLGLDAPTKLEISDKALEEERERLKGEVVHLRSVAGGQTPSTT